MGSAFQRRSLGLSYHIPRTGNSPPSVDAALSWFCSSSLLILPDPMTGWPAIFSRFTNLVPFTSTSYCPSVVLTAQMWPQWNREPNFTATGLSVCPGCDNAGLPPWQCGRHVQQLPCQWWALGGHGLPRRWCLDRHRYSHQVSFFIIQTNHSRYLLFSSGAGLNDCLYEPFINCKHFEVKDHDYLFLWFPQVPITISCMCSSFIQLTFSLTSRSSVMSIDFKSASFWEWDFGDKIVEIFISI